ncbi:ABC transporter substrate-binding protein [Afifella pfennigii]|uniref:ABC transporter substrate-binding protein n=1 Tax=Afifella pfennigii TaxID=209897 RepID=UPI00068BBF66|nr:ABC transporter substrate-binding protein [Afifella pfennigii]
MTTRRPFGLNGSPLAAPHISRRLFLAGAGSFAAAAGLPALPAFAAERLVLANWGGDAVDAYDTAFAEACREATGLALQIDGSGPLEGTIKAQVESGSVRWDVCDTELYSAFRLGGEHLQPIDYGIVDKARIMPETYEHAVPYAYYSTVIAYDHERFGDNPPKSWADFWDVEKYPGKRSLYKWMSGNLEAALLADGVAPADLYPLDVDRALAKIEELKPHILTHWGSAAEAQQLLRDREVSMVQIWHTRAILLEEDTGGRASFTFDQGLLNVSNWAVPKNNPAGRENAMKFINASLAPEPQRLLMENYRYGPVNPEAAAALPPELARLNPADPQNIDRQVMTDNRWYADEYGAALDRYTALIAG